MVQPRFILSWNKSISSRLGAHGIPPLRISYCLDLVALVGLYLANSESGKGAAVVGTGVSSSMRQ